VERGVVSVSVSSYRSGGVVVAVVTPGYPQRLVSAAIDECAEMMRVEFRTRLLSAAADSLSAAARRNVLHPFFGEWGDTPERDAAVRAAGAFQAAGSQMHGERDDNLEVDTAVLEERARTFRRQARALRRREMCKSRRMIAVILLMVVLVLTIVVTSLAGQ
jgi:hypothetical protein